MTTLPALLFAIQTLGETDFPLAPMLSPMPSRANGHTWWACRKSR